MAADRVAIKGNKAAKSRQVTPSQTVNTTVSQPLATGQQQQARDNSQGGTASPPRVRAVEKKDFGKDDLQKGLYPLQSTAVSAQVEDPPVITHPSSPGQQRKAKPQPLDLALRARSSSGGTGHTIAMASLSPRGPGQNDSNTGADISGSSHSNSSNPAYSGSDQSTKKKYRSRVPRSSRQYEDRDITARTSPATPTTTTTTTVNPTASTIHSSKDKQVADRTPPLSPGATLTGSHGTQPPARIHSMSSDSSPHGASSSGQRSSPDEGVEQRPSRLQRADENAIPARAISSDGAVLVGLKIDALELVKPNKVVFENWKVGRKVKKKISEYIDRVEGRCPKDERLDLKAIKTTVATLFSKSSEIKKDQKIQLVVDGVVAKRTIFQSAETLGLLRELGNLLRENRLQDISAMNGELATFAREHEAAIRRLQADLKAVFTGDVFFRDLTTYLLNFKPLNENLKAKAAARYQRKALNHLLGQLDAPDRTWRNSAPSDFYAPVPRNTPVSPQQLSPPPAPIEKQQDSSSHIETTSGSIDSKNTTRSDQGSGGSSLTMNDWHGPSIRSQGTPVKQQTDTPVSQSGATLLSSPLPKEAVPVLKLSEGAFKEALVNDLEEYATEGVGLYGEDVWNLLVAIANSLGDTKDPFDLRKLAQSAGLEANTEILREAVKKQAPPDLDFIALVVKLAAKAHLKRAATAMATGILHQAEPRSPPPSQPKGQEKHSD
ncbi:MAG: hypothetical protein JWP36_227 [Paucimonas sp.]|nr:hypothetical protein [Paucimonas sp.]